MRRPVRTLLLSSATAIAVGCGSSDPAATADTAAPLSSTTASTATSSEAATNGSTGVAMADAEGFQKTAAASAAGQETPEELIRQVTRLSATTLIAAGGESVGLRSAGDVSLKSINDPSLAAAERSRQNEIVQLSMEVIARTADDPERQQLFNNAVHYLSGAQVKLALGGDQRSERELLRTADELRQKDRTSFAAIEAGAKVVQLAREKADRDATPEMATAYARQARFFAAEFEHEVNRAAVTLLQAGRWCDAAGFAQPAAECYAALTTAFPKSLFAGQAAGALRRVSLVGKPLSQFGGPTIDGGFVQPKHYKGRPMAIVFWSPTDDTVPEVFAELDAVRKANPDLALIGVCIEDDQRRATMASEQLPACPQIYSFKPEERGRRNPLARHYGVERTPLVWLVAADGRVMSVDAKPSDARRLR